MPRRREEEPEPHLGVEFAVVWGRFPQVTGGQERLWDCQQRVCVFACVCLGD